MSRRLTSRLLASAVAAAFPLFCLSAAAAETSGVEEIIVSGQRQAYRGDVPLREIPQSILVIDADVLDLAGLTRLADALDLSAGMSRQNNFGGLWDNFAIRGFAGDENLPSGYLVNGFNAGRGFSGPRDAAGIERVEILKGPNAALFGRGEPGGSVNIVTRKPSFDTAASAALSVGSYGFRRGEADWTGPLADIAAIRLIGFHEEADSFRDTLESRRWGVLPSALLRLSQSTTLSYELELTRQEIPFDRGVVALGDRPGLIPIRRFLGEPGDGPLRAEATGHQFQLQHDITTDWSLLLGAGFRRTDLQGFSTEPELAVNRQRLFVDGRSLSRQRRFRDYEAEHTVYRGEVSGRFDTGSVEHRVLAGVDYDRFENSQLFLRSRPPVLTPGTTAQASNDIDILAPAYGRFPLPQLSPQTDRLDEQDAWGIYFQDQMRLTERIQLRLGLRHDSFRQDSLNRSTGRLTSFSDTKWSPQAGLVYEVSPSLTLYAAYGQGFRPNSGADAAGQPFRPEESESREVGAKLALLDGAVEGTLSLFQMRKTNILTADPQNAGFSIAIGEAESQGVELDLSGSLPGGIDVMLSYAYVDAQVARSALEPNFAALVRKGDRLINVPEHGVSLMAWQEMAVAGRALTLGGKVQHVGRRLGETATSFDLPAYTLLGTFVRYAVTDRISVEADAENLTNTEYYTNSFSRLWVAPGSPRTVTARLRITL